MVAFAFLLSCAGRMSCQPERTNLAGMKQLRDLYDEWSAEVLPAIEPVPPPKEPAATP